MLDYQPLFGKFSKPWKKKKKIYNIEFTATSSAKITTDKGVKLKIILSYKKIVENKKQVNKHTAYYFLLTSSKITLPKSSGIDR